MKYAVIAHSGRQYKVAEGDTVSLDFMATAKQNDPITFAEVLLVVDEGKSYIGTPHVTGATVAGTIVDMVKGEKIRVAKYKAKVRYRRVTGHRTKYTNIKIDKINVK